MSVTRMERPGQMGTEGDETMVLGSSLLPTMVPARVLIAPWGRVTSANGSFVVDEEAARAVMAAFARHGTDVPVDYEHQSLGGAYASPSGQAPAAGWIRRLHLVKPGEGEAGLFADVEWTEAGQARLAAREYRYLSPVVMVRKSDRRVMALHSVALTNKPAISGMRPIVNREEMRMGQDQTENNQGRRVENDAAGDVLSLEVEGDLDAAPAQSKSPQEGAVVEMLRLRLGLPVESDVEAVLLAANQRIHALSAELTQREARERVEGAFRAGKLSGAQQEWATQLAMENPQSFEAWQESAPVLVAIGRTTPPASATGSGGRNRLAIMATARAEFQAEPALASITTEEAWIEDALRDNGMTSE